MIDRVYVYAIAEAAQGKGRPFGPRVEVLDVKGVQLLAARSATPPALTERHLREQHEIVVRAARRCDAILPVRFGTVLDRPELERLIVTNRRAIRRALTRVRNREQMTIRIFDPSVAKSEPAGRSSGADYLRARRAAARPAMTPAGRALRAALKPLVAAERLDPPRGRIVLTMNHLIPRGVARAYRAAIRDAARELPPSLEIAVSGPWPPYAFAPELVR